MTDLGDGLWWKSGRVSRELWEMYFKGGGVSEVVRCDFDMKDGGLSCCDDSHCFLGVTHHFLVSG